MRMRFIEANWDEGPDFELFHESLGARVYKKITGKSGDDMTKWSELRKTMIAFG